MPDDNNSAITEAAIKAAERAAAEQGVLQKAGSSNPLGSWDHSTSILRVILSQSRLWKQKSPTTLFICVQRWLTLPKYN